MRIGGLQKLSLLDYPEKIACTIFTSGCNFRCPFCHNAGLVTHIDEKQLIPAEEVLRFLESRKGLLDGVCITGGEPLLQPDIAEFMQAIKKMGFLVKLDHNGSQPEKMQALVKMGLVDYVAMDIKNCREKYAKTMGVPEFKVAAIEKSVKFLLEKSVPYEFRTTVVKEFHTLTDVVKIGQWLNGAEAYYLQFFADSGDLIAGGNADLHAVSEAEMLTFAAAVKSNFKKVAVRGIED